MDSVERALSRVEGTTLAAGWIGWAMAAWASLAWLGTTAVRGVELEEATGLRNALLSTLLASLLLAMVVAPLHRAAARARHAWRAGETDGSRLARGLAGWGIPLSLLGATAAVVWGLVLAWRPYDLTRNFYDIDYFVEGAFTVPGAVASLVSAGLLLALLPSLARVASAGTPPGAAGPTQTLAGQAPAAAGPLATACRATLVAIQIALPVLVLVPIGAYATQAAADDHGMGGALLGIWTVAGLGILMAYTGVVTALLTSATRIGGSPAPEARGHAMAFLWTPALAGAAAVSLYMLGSSGGAMVTDLADGRWAPFAMAATASLASGIIAASSLTLLVLLARLMAPAPRTPAPRAPEVARA